MSNEPAQARVSWRSTPTGDTLADAAERDRLLSGPELAAKYPDADEWTVRASDYDQLAKAARELRAACKSILPPGFYAAVKPECDAIDKILNPKP